MKVSYIFIYVDLELFRRKFRSIRDLSLQPGDRCTMSLDSTAVFARRLEELKLSAYLNVFTEKGWDSMGNFAFSCAHAPGSSDDSMFLNEVVVPILGDPAHLLKP